MTATNNTHSSWDKGNNFTFIECQNKMDIANERGWRRQDYHQFCFALTNSYLAWATSTMRMIVFSQILASFLLFFIYPLITTGRVRGLAWVKSSNSIPETNDVFLIVCITHFPAFWWLIVCILSSTLTQILKILCLIVANIQMMSLGFLDFIKFRFLVG